MKIFSLKYILLGLTLLLFSTPITAQSFTHDPAHTFVIFRSMHNNVAYTFGRFDQVAATLNYDATNPSNSNISFSAATESVNTNNERRDGHLRSPDFFDATQFRTVNFVSTSISPTDQADVFEVTGDLTLHGVTKTTTVTVEKTGEGVNQDGKSLIGFYTEFTIDRTEYGMNNLVGPASAEILLMVSFEGVAQ